MRPLFTYAEWQTLVAQCHPAFFRMVWGDVKPRVRVKAPVRRYGTAAIAAMLCPRTAPWFHADGLPDSVFKYVEWYGGPVGGGMSDFQYGETV